LHTCNTCRDGCRGGPSPKYEYLSLEDAMRVPDKTRVNVYGVIVGFQQAKDCQGSHKFVSTFSLIDPSARYHTSPVVVNMFCHSVEPFPEFSKIGDIVRFHRAKKNKVQEKTVLTTYGDGNDSSYVVFRRRVDPFSGFPIVHTAAAAAAAAAATAADAAAAGYAQGASSSARPLPPPPLPPQADADITPLSPVRDKGGRIDLMQGAGGDRTKKIALPNLHESEWSYQSNSQHITFSAEDADVVKNLYNWGVQSFYNFSLHDRSTPLTTLREVHNSNYAGDMVSKFDSVCLVLSPPTRHLGTVTSACYSIKVWDASLAASRLGHAGGPAMQAQLGELGAGLGHVFAHSKGWPAALLTTLQAGSFCPGNGEAGDLTCAGDLDALNAWYLARVNQFLGDRSLVDQLKEDILSNYATFQIDDATQQDKFLRKYSKPGTWVRLRDVEAEFRRQPDNAAAAAAASSSGDTGVTTFKITRRTHINNVLPYFRDVLRVLERFLSEKASGQVAGGAELEPTATVRPPTAPAARNRQMFSSTGKPLTNLVSKVTHV
jgi:hypothetical protein